MSIGLMAAKLFPLLFNMMGPIGVIPAFAALTGAMDEKTRIMTARRASILAFCAMVAAVFIGSIMLRAWDIGNDSLIFAAGVVVTITALLPLIGQGGAGAGPGASATLSPLQLAVSPLAFPILVPPKAVAVLIIFVAFFPAPEEKLAVLMTATLMLVLNLIGMRFAKWFMATIGMTPLLVLGAVFGVLQVALGVEMMADGISIFMAR